MKIIVTGALGHLGSKLIRMIPEYFDNAEIVMLDSLLTQRYSSLFNLEKRNGCRYRFVESDILELEIANEIKGARAVIHLAALTEAMKSAKEPEVFKNINYELTRKIAEACANQQVPLIFPSSCSVYSPTQKYVDENSLGREVNAQSPYAKVKIDEENIIKKLAETNGLKYTIFRLGTIAGSSVGMRFHTAVNSFCWSAVLNKPLNIWETALNQKRPYLALNDFVHAIAFVIQNNLYKNETYNLLNGNYTVSDIVENIKKRIPNLEIKLVKCDIMNDLNYEVGFKKFTDTGFSYHYSIEKSIEDTLNFFDALT